MLSNVKESLSVCLINVSHHFPAPPSTLWIKFRTTQNFFVKVQGGTSLGLRLQQCTKTPVLLSWCFADAVSVCLVQGIVLETILLHSLRWPWTHDFPVSAFSVLGFQVCRTMPGQALLLDWSCHFHLQNLYCVWRPGGVSHWLHDCELHWVLNVMCFPGPTCTYSLFTTISVHSKPHWTKTLIRIFPLKIGGFLFIFMILLFLPSPDKKRKINLVFWSLFSNKHFISLFLFLRQLSL